MNATEISAVPVYVPAATWNKVYEVGFGSRHAHLQKVDSIPTYFPRRPSFRITCFTTSIGPLKALVFSWSLETIWQLKRETFRKDHKDWPDLDEFEWYDNKTFLRDRWNSKGWQKVISYGRPSTTPSQDREILVHLGFAVEIHECLSPEIISSTFFQ